MNTQSQLVIKTKYDEAYPFSNNLARVKKKGKYGFIKPTGIVYVPLVYDSVSDYINGQAYLTGTLFFLDTLGVKKRLVLGCGTSGFYRCDYRVFIVNELKGLLRTHPYDTLIKPKYLNIKLLQSNEAFAVKNHTGKYGIVSGRDSIIQPFIYDTLFVRDSNYRRWVETKVGILSGGLHPNGTIISQAKYLSIRRSQYCFLVELENGKSGFIYNLIEYWKH
jgi:hypothetical protein